MSVVHTSVKPAARNVSMKWVAVLLFGRVVLVSSLRLGPGYIYSRFCGFPQFLRSSDGVELQVKPPTLPFPSSSLRHSIKPSTETVIPTISKVFTLQVPLTLSRLAVRHVTSSRHVGTAAWRHVLDLASSQCSSDAPSNGSASDTLLFFDVCTVHHFAICI